MRSLKALSKRYREALDNRMLLSVLEEFLGDEPENEQALPVFLLNERMGTVRILLRPDDGLFILSVQPAGAMMRLTG